MISRIISSIILLCLLIAIPLSLMGYTYVELGSDFLSFMSTCNRELNDFKIAIPNIPTIPYVDSLSGWFLDVINLLITMFNSFVIAINMLINFLNVVLQLFEFIFIVLKNLITMVTNSSGAPLPDITL